MINIALQKAPTDIVPVTVQWSGDDPVFEVKLEMHALEFAWHRCLHVLNNPNRYEHCHFNAGSLFHVNRSDFLDLNTRKEKRELGLLKASYTLTLFRVYVYYLIFF
jgi:hypothetical protein